MKAMIRSLNVIFAFVARVAAGRINLNSYLEVEEYSEQAEEHSHGGEAKYQEGLPPNPLYHQALRREKMSKSTVLTDISVMLFY